MFNPNDTIAAIATCAGEAGISIIRISGKEALSVADRIFIAKDGKKPSGFKTYTLHYGWVVDILQGKEGIHAAEDGRRATNNEQRATSNERRATAIVDEALLTVMRAPKSYTREDVVELSCHGGLVAMRRVLELALDNGCRLAERGEFTLRAFLNGRIDLAQAEAVADIISAKTGKALSLSVNQLKGELSDKLKSLRRGLLDLVSNVEADIDFPEEDVDKGCINRLKGDIDVIEGELSLMLQESKTGKILREGVSVCIFGRPNVGKSSLLNALLKEERAIVTPVAGTTRDTIEEVMDIRGIPVKIIDTAGIVEPKDLVEKKAVDRSRRYFKKADMLLLVLDGSKPLNKEDAGLMKKMAGRSAIIVANKADLKEKLKLPENSGMPVVKVSALKRRGIADLETAIVNKILGADIRAQDKCLLSNTRHIHLVKKAQKFMLQARKSLDEGLSQEFIAVDLRASLDCLGGILGENLGENILENIFSRFCIGK